mmetsp:Transcript_17967/g.39297  ORF Transcript_17967/g.39297 Transcript_17967/m.39297 type:complete len:365 (-) Transcript_17967:31-1125(-)
MVLRVVLIGYGQIARRQHVPILLSRPGDFELCAIVDPVLASRDVDDYDDDDIKARLPAPMYSTLDEALLAAAAATATESTTAAASPLGTKYNVAVIIACPPQFAQDYAERSLRHGISVFMEKPPGLDYRRLGRLQSLAEQRRLTLYTAYHSTAARGVKRAREWANQQQQLHNHQDIEISIAWKESCAKWHPGQTWIAESKLGALDMLINPISMVEEIVGRERMASMTLDAAKSSMVVIPRNWNGPISGTVCLVGDSGLLTVHADFAWDYQDDADVWTISFESRDGSVMNLYDGGAQLKIDGVDVARAETATDILRPEYETLYERFVELVATKESEVRATPLRIVNDILEEAGVSSHEGAEYTLA